MRKLESYHLETFSSGNISLREGDFIAIKPSNLSYDEVNASNISIVDIKGNHIRGLPPSSDLRAHLSIYKNRKDINCIIHTHAHYATVLAILGKNIKVISTMHADYFGKEIPCLPFTNHRIYNFGEEIIKKDSQVYLLERHGAVVLGKNIAQAIKFAVVLEEVAKLTYETLLLLKKNTLNEINLEETKVLFNNYIPH